MKASVLRVHGCRHLFSSYLWYSSILILAVSLVLTFPSHYTDPCPSAERSFNSSVDPTFFVHITDSHIAHNRPKSNKRYLDALKFIKYTKTKTLINTGDLVDNWIDHKHIPHESGQNVEDHILYKKLANDTGPYITLHVDQSGNHDLFDVYSYGSDNMHFLKYSRYYSKFENLSYSDYLVSTVQAEDCIFVIINPQLFPPSRALLDLFVYPSRYNLDTIEDTIIEACETNLSVIVLNHFPIDQWYDIRSSRGRSFHEMISYYNVSLALDGHTHPGHFHPNHHGTNLEIIGSDTKQHNNLAIVTIDNKNIGYTAFKCNSTPKAVVTYPIPTELVTRHTMFNQPNIDIRLLVFTESEVEIFCDGNKMEFDRYIRPGIALYHLKASFPPGENTIEFTGFYENNLTFFVGNILPSHYEFLGNLYNLLFSSVPVVYVLMIIFTLIVFPFPVEFKFKAVKDFADRRLKWLFNNQTTCIESLLNIIPFGPLIVRWRFLRLPIVLRTVIFTLMYFPFVCPICIQTLDGHYGFVSIYGYYNGGHNTPHIYGSIFLLIHMWFDIAPMTFLLSMLALEAHWTWWFVLDIIYALFGFAFCLAFTIYKLSETTRFIFWAFNPIFVLCPIGFFVTIIVCRRVCPKPDWSDIAIFADNTDLSSHLTEFNSIV